jgi:hypothetical protein
MIAERMEGIFWKIPEQNTSRTFQNIPRKN